MVVTGAQLRQEREAEGVLIKDVAARLGHSRNTVAEWESRPEVDARRARLHRAAVRAIVREEAAA